MSRVTDIIAATYAVRHRHGYGSLKTVARIRWDRRKKWKTRKDPARRNSGRK